MIRLVQRRLIVPRGDTGTFSIPILAGKDSGDAAIFTVFDPLMHRKIFEKEMSLSDGALGVDFTHNDTVNLPVGQYVWDIKFYTDPLIVDGKLVGGTEVDSYYSAFTLPICEIRETGDNLLMSDDAPTGALRPGQVDIITASIREITSLKESAAESAANADTSATNAEGSASAAATSAQDALDSKVAALAAQQTASAASENAASAAALAAQRADQVMVELGTKADIEDLAAVAFSGLYSDLSGVPTIPQRVSDLQDDSGHYTKPVGGIPASDLAAGVLDIWSGLTYHTSTMSTDSDSFVLGGATDAPTEINKCLVTSTPNANVIPKFDYQGRLHSVTPEDEWDGSNAVATTEYVDNMISDNMPEVPTNVSELNNDAGYITGYTETDPTVPAWAKAAQKPTYTAAEVGAPTVAEMNTAIGTAIGNINSFDMAVVQALPTEDISTHTIYLVPKTGETNDVYDEYVYINNAWEMVGNTQIDLSNYVQKTDIATADTAGIIKLEYDTILDAVRNGGTVLLNNKLTVVGAPTSKIKLGQDKAALLSAASIDSSVFYGLAKAAGDDTQSVSTNAVGTYTDEAKEAIQQMLDVPSTSDIPSVPVQDVQVNGTSVISNGVANVPVASVSTHGVVKVNSKYAIIINPNTGEIMTNNATIANIKEGTDIYKPIASNRQDAVVFYGLAKAAGDSTQSVSTNAIGTYTNEAKAAIQSMLGVADASQVAVVPGTGAGSAKTKDFTYNGSTFTQVASGIGAYAFGFNNTASGNGSFAEGSTNTASGGGSHVEGNGNVASGAMSHVEGYLCAASGRVSHVEGHNNNANHAYQHVNGEYNVYDPSTAAANERGNYIEITGNGTATNARSNAYALEWNGTAHYAGDVYVGANADSTGGTRLATVTEVAAKLDAAEAGLKVVRLI